MTGSEFTPMTGEQVRQFCQTSSVCPQKCRDKARTPDREIGFARDAPFTRRISRAKAQRPKLLPRF